MKHPLFLIMIPIGGPLLMLAPKIGNKFINTFTGEPSPKIQQSRKRVALIIDIILWLFVIGFSFLLAFA